MSGRADKLTVLPLSFEYVPPRIHHFSISIFFPVFVKAYEVCSWVEAYSAIALKFAINKLALLYFIVVPYSSGDASDTFCVFLELARDETVFFPQFFQFDIRVFKHNFLLRLL